MLLEIGWIEACRPATAPGDECKHFKLIGTTGTGKSTGIREMLARALGREDRAIFADPDGGYLARFFDARRGDVILSPFHPGARKWDPFLEVENDQDVDALAQALIPDRADAEPIWTQHARVLISQLMRQCLRAQVRDAVEWLRPGNERPAGGAPGSAGGHRGGSLRRGG